MADRNIVTQAGLEDLKFALDEVAANLSRHVNASLSKAHGINIINGYIDEHGNDLTVYRDASGVVIGDYQVLFTIDNVNYYAPARTTALAGQNSSNGSVDTSSEGEFSAQASAVWVTDYTSNQVPQAESMNNDVLIPHTQQPHWLVHGGVSVVAQPTYNSLGVQIGTHVVQIKYNNILYNIPVSNKFGGPNRTPSISGIASNLFVHFNSGDPNSCDVPITFTLLAGTLPVLFHWQFNNGGVWTDIAPSPSSAIVIPGWNAGIGFSWADTGTTTFRIISAFPGSNQTRSVQLRVRATNSASPDTGPLSGIISNVCTFTCQDDT